MSKTRKIIGWVFTFLLAVIFVGSAIGKLTMKPDMIKMAQSFGFTIDTFKVLATIEILSIFLFAVPRTGIVGTLLLAAYMGGAIATHLQHGMPLTAPVLIEAGIWITAAIRFPELTRRLTGRS